MSVLITSCCDSDVLQRTKLGRFNTSRRGRNRSRSAANLDRDTSAIESSGS
jgi:hypothetical protein